VARANFARAGMSDRVDLRVGRALDILPAIAAQGAGPFDLVFIDADKANSASYLAWATTLSRPGTVIVTDNVVRAGAVLDGASNDPNVTGIRQLFDRLREDCKLNSTAIQTVGVKGWDGFAITVVE
jgi:predicted O-methyltransferase YrrM